MEVIYASLVMASISETTVISDGANAVRTAHFVVTHQESLDLAREVAAKAEAARRSSIQKWFGGRDAGWQPPCEIHLHRTGHAYSQATGIPETVPGVTSIQRDGARIISMRIDVHGEADDLLEAIIPHEVAHLVVACGFGEQRAPLWISEAMCILCEPRAHVDRRLRDLNGYRRAGLLLPVDQLMGSGQPRDGRHLPVYYAQAASVVDWLVTEKGCGDFTQFVRTGAAEGYEKALIKHYGLTFAELESRWRKQTFRVTRLALAR